MAADPIQAGNASSVACPSSSIAPAGALRLERPATVSNRIVWRYAAAIGTIHALAALAFWPWLFSWTGVALCVAGVYFYGGLGINIAYHRLLTHRSFKCPLWLERLLVLVAVCCFEDTPGTWVATHRLHHNDSDTTPDPHSPLVNFLWAHLGWMLVENRDIRCCSAYERYARDVLRDPFYMRLQRTELPVLIYLAHAAVYFAGGFLAGWWMSGQVAGGWQLGLSALVWGVFLRTVLVWHISWSVNSLTHVFGYRSYPTSDNSRNNWLVALLTSGEGWHNNHHDDPSSANNWHRWWEVDLMYVVIRGLERLGLASDVIDSRHRRQQHPARPGAFHDLRSSRPRVLADLGPVTQPAMGERTESLAGSPIGAGTPGSAPRLTGKSRLT